MKLSLIRKAATGILLVDAFVVAAAAVQVDAVVSRTTTTPSVATTPAYAVPVTAPPPVPVVAPQPGPGVSLTGSGSSFGTGALGGPVQGKAPHQHRHAVSPAQASQQNAAVPASSPTDLGGAAQAGRTIPPCPIALSKDPQTGGLQSLVPFAPAFGPYAAEGFALASAYQPELQLLGPILAKYPQIQPAVTPVLGPVAASLGALLNLGYDSTKPLYEPYRTQFLEAETKLAAALAPYSQSLAYNELGGCVVELESALTTAATATPGASSAPAGPLSLPLLSGLHLGSLG